MAPTSRAPQAPGQEVLDQRNALGSKKFWGGVNAAGGALGTGILFLQAHPDGQPWQLLMAMAIGAAGGLFQVHHQAKIDILKLKLADRRLDKKAEE